MGAHFVFTLGRVGPVLGVNTASITGQQILGPGFEDILFFVEPGSRKFVRSNSMRFFNAKCGLELGYIVSSFFNRWMTFYMLSGHAEVY